MALLRVLPILLLLAAPAAAQDATSIVVFPVELLDTSGEVGGPGHDARLALATEELTRVLQRSGRYRAVDLSPFASEVAATAPRYDCSGCWLDVARKTGAALAVVSSVHKVSSLISTMDFRVADLKSGQYVAHVQGQIRGDTDDAYRRGVDVLAGGRLLQSMP
jgi:hypothetical protein